VTSLSYSPELDDQSSRDFAVLARGLKEAIESEYMTVPGQQTVDVLQFRYITHIQSMVLSMQTSLYGGGMFLSKNYKFLLRKIRCGKIQEPFISLHDSKSLVS